MLRPPKTSRLAPRTPRVLPAAVLALAAFLAFVAAGAHAAKPVASPHGGLREACADCHAPTGWSPARITPAFDHARTGFPLAGAHAATACGTCHASLDFSRGRVACVACHADPHRGELGLECARCHSARSFLDRGPWAGMHRLTRFPLTGAHLALDCESCHPRAQQGRMQFVGTDPQCRGCHMADYQATSNPGHVAGGYPLECETCHGEVTWARSSFDHEGTAFPLEGSHRHTPCAACHAQGGFRGAPTSCLACHQAQYAAAVPVHEPTDFPDSRCGACHRATTWTGGRFDHAATPYPLTGAHLATACADCHANGVYRGRSTDCASCHLTEYDAATPNHMVAGFPASACGRCHNTTSWAVSIAGHGPTVAPLTGAHRALACESCHSGGASRGPSTDCAACHRAEYDSALPRHEARAFPAPRCASCHTTATWSGARIEHAAFPIDSGPHAGAWKQCSDCHTTPGNDAAFDCAGSGCHDPAPTAAHHGRVDGYRDDAPACYACHARGR